jgi:signal transduction histidine kinase
VRLEWHADGDCVISSDPLKLKMIVRNLVTNALKFTERGSVTTTATSLGGGVELQVVDTGIGIAADKLATIFEPFTQAHGLQSRRKGGAGLGLHLVRRLVDVLDGTIAVQSEVGRGTTFRVWIPDATRTAVHAGGTRAVVSVPVHDSR